MVTVSAPGKLMISGEWAVLEVGNPCIVAAVNRRVYAEVTDAQTISVSLPDFGIKATGSWDGKLSWKHVTEEQEEKLVFTKAAIETALTYVGEEKTFALKSWGGETQLDVNGEQEKVGFGSSAAAVVAQIAGILKYCGKGIETIKEKEVLFKLAAIAHCTAQGKVGSAFDVAASTFGGVIMYARFDPEWLREQMQAGVSYKDLVEEEWPGLRIEPLPIPEGLQLLVGWTRKGASTRALMKQIAVFKHLKRDRYNEIYKRIAELVEKTIVHWKAGSAVVIIKNLNKNQELLEQLTKEADVDIATPLLQKLAEIAQDMGAAGKLSGAGGGDCGIAITFDEGKKPHIEKRWQEAGIQPLDVTIDSDGVKA